MMQMPQFYCFLAVVKAQIDTRNAVIGYLNGLKNAQTS
jgi:hypothetical protein